MCMEWLVLSHQMAVGLLPKKYGVNATKEAIQLLKYHFIND